VGPVLHETDHHLQGFWVIVNIFFTLESKFLDLFLNLIFLAEVLDLRLDKQAESFSHIRPGCRKYNVCIAIFDSGAEAHVEVGAFGIFLVP